jgi:DNA-damage-inducible protein J
MKTEIIHARIEPFLKQNAEKIFRRLGMTTSEAISIFMGQVVLNKGLPFPVSLPNATTRKAIDEARAGKGNKHRNAKALFDDMDK